MKAAFVIDTDKRTALVRLEPETDAEVLLIKRMCGWTPTWHENDDYQLLECEFDDARRD